MQRESMQFDLVIVGAGPAGLSAAIRFKQLCQQQQKDYSVCVLEKGAEIGAQILSGNVFEPRALDELLPNWKTLGAPLLTPVTQDSFYFLTPNRSFHLPTPPSMQNHGNFIISLAQLCRWLATQAESLGVDIFPGFAAHEVLFNEQEQVIGVRTGDMGVDKNGHAGSNFQPGMDLLAKQTLFAEGCRGSCSQSLIEKFKLNANSDPQTYAIGIKEIWKVDSNVHKPGSVMHSIGWPLDTKTYGGSFLYHLQDQKVAYGFVTGLDYQNPWLSPFEESQRLKTHPLFRGIFENGERLEYGARALNEGGWQSIPKLTFPGGALIGCSAGFMNVPKIKGSHTAMKSGMLAAEAAFSALESATTEIFSYSEALKHSWIATELKSVRNIRPSFHWGLWAGLAYSALDTYLLRGLAPWTLHHRADHSTLLPADQAPKIEYPKPDGKITFDKMSSVFLSNVRHDENQPCHLTLKNSSIPIEVNLKHYQSPESRYCPAGVYEIVYDANQPRLQINAANCVHCKTCDIKDPMQNIVWTTPEGGSGPNYIDM